MSERLGFENLTKAELDKNYSPSQWVPGCIPSEVIERHINFCQTETLRAKLLSPSVELHVKYNKTSSSVHFFNPQTVNPDTPLVVYIHGGYWSAGVLEDSGGFCANT